jgi:gliding motility-associated-like protein
MKATKLFTRLFVLAAVFSHSFLKAQDIPIQVINTAGGGGVLGSGTQVYYNIGETVINTINGPGSTVTQGFLQPGFVGDFGLTATAMFNNVTCADKNDGFISIAASVSGASNPSLFTYQYHWTDVNNPSIDPCPGNDCSSLDSLSGGTFSVIVVSVFTGVGTVPNDTVIIQNIIVLNNSEPCQIEIFNGVTPNGDGHNDFFFIRNIEGFPSNIVQIYNRWGQKLDEINGYDNTSLFWPDLNKASAPPSGTYFYVIDLGNGTKLLKGWIELTRK